MPKDGKKAERVIWSTASLNAAVEAIKKGLPLKANPFDGRNTKLLKPDLVYKYTDEEIEDYIKCKSDPIYFASKCYLMQPEGLLPCELRDYQEDYLRHLQKNRFSIFLSCRQSGKSTTTAIYCLWVILFNVDKRGLILSKSGPAGVDLLSKIKDMYMFLPYHLKCGTMKWNQTEISFDNNSSISTEAFSPTAGLGKTINFLILDEFAWCPQNDVDLFYNNIIPTITTDPTANVCIMSTQNGFNKFYDLYTAAERGDSIYAPFKVDWQQVPQWDADKKVWYKRDEEWKKKMIGVLGSEEDFYYQYGTMFSASDRCLVGRECLNRIRKGTVKFPTAEKLCETTDNTVLNSITLQYKKYLHLKPDYDYSRFTDGQHFFILLCDLAEGGGGDYTVFNIIEVTDKDKFEQVGYWRSNKVDLDHAALEFWLLTGQWFNGENCLWSIEWNTYGALFFQIISNLNEVEYQNESYWRFNVCPQGIDVFNVVRYKKMTIEEEIQGKTSNKYLPGIKFTSSNKVTACSLLKLMFEHEDIIMTDFVSSGELENFEDKNGNGSYKAAYGNDDIIMTFCQLPMLKQTPRYKDFVSDIAPSMALENEKENTNIYDFLGNVNKETIFTTIGETPWDNDSSGIM